ncbi:MAG: hypothetical protein CL846_02095 [Crocinitomicaceae bacterium]|nr:hypothetical protein [Crocinitomicaceae bacterium]|tara:strand:+ start:964 stop:2094 length:1131 start_codon:yes stop_codon:yes gene_type:complete
MSLFSFIKHPVENYMNSIQQLYPGIHEAFGCFTSYENKLKIISLNDGEFSFIDDKEILRSFIRFSKKINNQNWLNNESIPIKNTNHKRQNIKQLKIEDEENNLWLVLKTKSKITSSYDVVLIKVNKSNTFGVNAKSKSFSTSKKALIANIINTNFQHFIKNSYENYNALSLLNKSIETLKDIISNQNKKSTVSEKKYKQIFIQYINKIIYNSGNKLGFNISCSEEYIENIINSKFDISIIEKTIKQSVYISVNSHINRNNNIELGTEHLIWPNNSLSIINTKHRDNSTIELLDRYESAAVKANNQGFKIIGSTVGECCTPSVSAASITFNIKKHESKIFDLLNNYEDQWPTLRSQFKPIKNVINNFTEKNDKLKMA